MPLQSHNQTAANQRPAYEAYSQSKDSMLKTDMTTTTIGGQANNNRVLSMIEHHPHTNGFSSSADITAAYNHGPSQNPHINIGATTLQSDSNDEAHDSLNTNPRTDANHTTLNTAIVNSIPTEEELQL